MERISKIGEDAEESSSSSAGLSSSDEGEGQENAATDEGEGQENATADHVTEEDDVNEMETEMLDCV